MSNAFRIFRKLLNHRVLIYGSLAVLSLLVMGLALLRTRVGEAFVRQTIQAIMESAIPTAEVELGHFEWAGWTESRFESIRLGVPNEVPLLEIASIQLDVWRYARGQYVGQLILEQPIVQITQDEVGVSNVDRLFPSTESTDDSTFEWPSLPVDILLYTIEVQDGRLHYLDEHLNSNVDLTLGWKDDRVILDVCQFDVASPEYGDLSTTVSVNGDDQQLQVSARIEHEKLLVNLTSSVQSAFEQPMVNGEISVRLAENAGEVIDLGAVPMQAISVSLTLAGTPTDLRAALRSDIGLTGSIYADIEDEAWRTDLYLDTLTPSDVYPDLEPIILNGTLAASGKGWSLNTISDGKLTVNLTESLLWNEALQQLTVTSSLTDGQLQNMALHAEHDAGEVDLSGLIDIVNQSLDLKLNAHLTDLQTWMPEWDADVQAQHVVQGTWATPMQLEFQGALVARDVHGSDGFEVVDVKVESTGTWNGQVTQVQNLVQIQALEAVGVFISAMTGDVGVTLNEAGLDVLGQTDIEQVTVGDGTLQLQYLTGGFRFVQDEAVFFETSDMTVGNVTLVPAQYVIDGGDLALQLDGDALLANLHLTRKGNTFIDTRAHANINDGVWQVDELKFSPTGERPWSLKDGFSFQVMESGIGDMALQLDSDAGSIQVRVDQQNEQPDVMVDIQDLDLGYVAEVTNLFVAPETLPPDLAGTAFGTLHLLGEGGRFQQGDFLLFKDVTIPTVATDLQLAMDISGDMSDVAIQLDIDTNEQRIVELQVQVPLTNGQVDCTRQVFANVLLPEHQLQDLSSTLLVVPDMDLITMTTGTLTGTMCEPHLQLFTQGHTPVGMAGERVRWEMDLSLVDDQLIGSGEVSQAVQSWFRIALDGQTDIAAMLNGNPEADLFKEITMSIDVADLYLQKIGRLMDVPDIGRGKLDGGIVAVVTPTDWRVDGRIDLPNVRLAKHRLTEDSGVELHMTPSAVDGNWTLDFLQKGAFNGTLNWSMESDQILLSSGWDDVPAMLIAVAVPDMNQAYGRLSGSLLVDGTSADPHVNLVAQLDNFGFEMPSLGTRYRNIDVEVIMDDRMLTIPIMSGEATILQNTLVPRWGRFSGSSTITVEEDMLATMELRLSEFPLIHTNSMQATVSGRLTGRQNMTETEFDGQLYVHQGLVRLERDFFEEGASLALPPELLIHRDVDIQQKNTEEDGWLDDWMSTLKGNVVVDLGDRIPIHTTMPMTNDYGESLSKLSEVKVDTDIRGVLDVGWLLGEPTILGTISTIRGAFVTMGKAFELGSGEIVFSGANAYNPQLNLVASKGFGEYGTVNVLVGGTVDEIDMQFEAINTPYVYDATDIVTLILLGKPSQELAQSESQTAATLIQTGLTTMGGVVGDAFGGTMVDNVDWDPTEGMFRVGKTLSDTLYLSYMRNYWAEEGENQNEITLEWLLLQKVYGELITGDANNTHATLYYRWIF